MSWKLSFFDGCCPRNAGGESETIVAARGADSIDGGQPSTTAVHNAPSRPLRLRMLPVAVALFDTPIGACGLAWGPAGIAGLLLPGATPQRTLATLRGRYPEAVASEPPPGVRQAIDRIVALLNGHSDDLADLPLDMAGVPDFHRRVYEAARRIGPGRTCTYGQLADALGEPGAARAVGQALGANPFAVIVPCHRVLAAGGRGGGFSAPGGVDTKLRLLEIERARIGDQASLFDAGS
jgi:methylated-DNA-[protein]-cysteine S-methyltransferase